MKQLLKRHSFRAKKSNIKSLTEDECEVCVLCGKKTNVKRSVHVDLRDRYVEGCGQLCSDCWKAIFK